MRPGRERTMQINIKTAVTVLLAMLLMTFGQAVAQEEGESKEASGGSQLQNRIDFGNSYIMGQSITSGSVYLLNRKKSDINSMLKVRENFRDEIIEEFSLEDSKIISDEADVEETD